MPHSPPQSLQSFAKDHGFETISFEGAYGAYSHIACRQVFPELKNLPCNTFDDAFRAVSDRKADLAMIPVENTLAGRVADVHRLLPKSGLYIIGETFLTIRHNLLGIKGSKLDDVREVHSHIHAIPQCNKFIVSHGLRAITSADTAGAAKEIAETGDPAIAAIASDLAAEIYGLKILEKDIQDESHNATRFLILAREPQILSPTETSDFITSVFFKVRNIPAALYKALGGFATNGINLTKLESYVDKNFQAALFYCDLESHADTPSMKLAFEELNFYAEEVHVIGTYFADPFRKRQ